MTAARSRPWPRCCPQLVDRALAAAGQRPDVHGSRRARRSSVRPSPPLLVVTVGPGWALAVDASPGLVSAAAPAGDAAAAAGRPSRAGTPATSPSCARGGRCSAGTPWLWQVVLGFAVLNAIHSGAWLTLGPAQAHETIGAKGWGLVLSAESVGLLVMTVVLLRVPLQRPVAVGHGRYRHASASRSCCWERRPTCPLLLVAAVVAGAGFEVFSMGWNLAMQENIEERHLSRAYSYDALGSYAAMPLGQLIRPAGRRRRRPQCWSSPGSPTPSSLSPRCSAPPCAACAVPTRSRPRSTRHPRPAGDATLPRCVTMPGTGDGLTSSCAASWPSGPRSPIRTAVRRGSTRPGSPTCRDRCSPGSPPGWRTSTRSVRWPASPAAVSRPTSRSPA